MELKTILIVELGAGEHWVWGRKRPHLETHSKFLAKSDLESLLLQDITMAFTFDCGPKGTADPAPILSTPEVI